jgi:hypothetical protein
MAASLMSSLFQSPWRLKAQIADPPIVAPQLSGYFHVRTYRNAARPFCDGMLRGSEGGERIGRKR